MTNATNVVEVQELIDTEKFTPYQMFIMVLCFFVMFIDGFDMTAIGFSASSILKEWHISKATFSPAMSAAVIGLAIGSVVAGPIADRIGRKKVLVGSMIIGGLTIACSYATNVTELAALRLITGIGLGAAMPAATTLMSEYTPSNKRGAILNAIFCGFPIGASSGGLISAAIIPSYGWRTMFIIGGTIPLILCFALAYIPESVRFMVTRGYPADKVASVLRRIKPGIDAQSRFVLREDVPQTRENGISVVLSSHFRFGTFALWSTYFCGLGVYYMLTSWMPTIFRDSGLSTQHAAIVTSLLSFGGFVGTVCIGFLIDRYEPHRIVACSFALASVFICLIGQQPGGGDILPLAMLTFLSGVCMNGAICSLPTLAAMYYPTVGRATGVAWMMGAGRFGGMIGAFSGGLLLQANYSTGSVFLLLAAPAIVAAIAVTIKNGVSKRNRHDDVSNKRPAPKMP